MNKNVVKYKDSLKKQITYTLIWFGIICLPGYYLHPVNTLGKIVIFAPVATILAAIATWLVNKAAKEVICPFCSNDLYEVIQTAKQKNLEFKHRPSCGNEVQI